MIINKVSEELYSKAVGYIPGGVNSPVRAFRSVGLCPHFIKSGQGSHIVDEDGNDFIDYVCSWGPLILGHANPEVLDAISRTMRDGTSFGAPTRREIDMAELISELVPSIEMVRLVSSGTEATMSAIRLARGYTGREKIVKFSGCYHGHSDGLLAKAGSGAATFSIPDSLGAPKSLVEQTIVLPYNDLEGVRECFQSMPGQIAAIIVEPIAGNMGVVKPLAGFLEGLRDICSSNGSLLIFDEVISGFRVALGGAQELYGVIPDLTCLGKIIGGGLPVGAFRWSTQDYGVLGASWWGISGRNAFGKSAGCFCGPRDFKNFEKRQSVSFPGREIVASYQGISGDPLEKVVKKYSKPFRVTVFCIF